MGEGSPIGTVAEGSGAATAVTRAELVAFQGKIEERLAELLSLARTQPGDGDATTPPAQRKRHAQRGAIVYHPDGFDDSNLPAADDIIQAYEVPAAVRRRDGIPVPFEPADARFLARFKDGSSEFHEAAFADQVAAWTQELSNAAVALYYERDSFSAAGMADRLAGGCGRCEPAAVPPRHGAV
ncbi:hypothetical protein I4F81_012481 [Pyropia yezoensis]|uniref:Uncharacterized protein n=1 Tax=Pyropia yezoensis TaxID=2788 RepID=A0ACC3CIJ6_PYRYE|nr:hypothetical protein I4F81_012481 [Neopyropia yezoensis]